MRSICRRGRALTRTVMLITVTASISTLYVEAGPRLQTVRTIVISPPPTQVDEVLELGSGMLAVRDSDWDLPDTSGIYLFNSSGEFIRKIGRQGTGGPGTYRRLMGIARDRAGNIWAVDALTKRVTVFDPGGKIEWTKLLMRFTAAFSLRLDEPRGFIYVGGWLPGWELGRSDMVHQYTLNGRKYVKSFLREDPSFVEKRLTGQAVVHMDVDAAGNVWAVQEPAFKVYRIDPGRGTLAAYAIRSRIASPPPRIEGGLSEAVVTPFWNQHFFVSRVLVAGNLVVVSITRAEPRTEVWEVFDKSGRQIATDITPPGHLVGSSPGGRLFLVTSRARQTIVSLVRISFDQRAR